MMPLLASVLLLGPVTLSIDNVKPGETVRYPLLILRGATEGPAVLAGLGWKSVVRFPAYQGHYAAVVELKPGPNMVILTSGRETVKLAVDYRPMASPYRVRTVYLLAKDEGTDYDGPPEADRTQYRAKLDLALKMMQSVAAESMNEAGYGRKTFPLEFGPDGKVVIHLVRTGATGNELRALDGNALWARFNEELGRQFDYGVDKVCGVMAFTRWMPRSQKALGHTALGGGGLGLFSGGSIYTWPTALADVPKVFADARPIDTQKGQDDSGLRGTMWAAPATTIGAMLHEMGHTFGLPHSADPRSVMSRGFDQFNRRFAAFEPPTTRGGDGFAVSAKDATHYDPFEAARLNLNPWFQPDGYRRARFPAALPPRVTLDGDDIAVSAPYGLGLVGAVREGKPGVYRGFKGVTTARIKRSEMGEGEAGLIAVDLDGNQTDVKLP